MCWFDLFTFFGTIFVPFTTYYSKCSMEVILLIMNFSGATSKAKCSFLIKVTMWPKMFNTFKKIFCLTVYSMWNQLPGNITLNPNYAQYCGSNKSNKYSNFQIALFWKMYSVLNRSKWSMIPICKASGEKLCQHTNSLKISNCSQGSGIETYRKEAIYWYRNSRQCFFL